MGIEQSVHLEHRCGIQHCVWDTGLSSPVLPGHEPYASLVRTEEIVAAL